MITKSTLTPVLFELCVWNDRDLVIPSIDVLLKLRGAAERLL